MALLSIFGAGPLTKMPSEDYTPTASTGKLKLKGVKDAKISKKKKNKSSKDEKYAGDIVEDNSIMLRKLEEEDREIGRDEEKKRKGKSEEPVDGDVRDAELGIRVKTEAERRYDEQRRKRVCLSLFRLPFITTVLVRRNLLYFGYQVFKAPVL